MDNVHKDLELWKKAKARASFKSHLRVYIIINSFLWLLWLITDASAFPWPIFVTLGWGIGVVVNYFKVYRSEKSLAEQEYEKLIQEKEERLFFEEKRYLKDDI